MRTRLAAALLLAMTVAACGQASTGSGSQPTSGGAGGDTVRLYTTVTQETVDAVVAAFAEAQPDTQVEVFRAPTGELNARIAAERREGGLQADVLWLTDPLSMQQFDAEGLLAAYAPAEVDAVPAEYRTDTFTGTRLLNLVIVHEAGLDPAPRDWPDLADPAYRDAVAIPDPSFAGSAFGALGYFAETDGGLDFYQSLADNGVVQVPSPGEVTSGVAEGRFMAGMTLDADARAAAEAGSPVELVVPESGAIAVYSPIAVTESAANTEGAEAFVDFSLTVPAQEAIAGTGWEPIRDDVEWEHEAKQVSPDWPAIYDRQDELLEEYQAVIGG
ncbi:MAG: extracellular solute-binding protein [Actinomycetota bacterium]|nr:extracellular solute-binding protein [Euzebyales bacterium]MDQ3452945.1 extracellular solute-binding protein [Actinomycetota bacterium]